MTQLTVSQTSRRLPRGLWLLVVIDFWERFSYYGMLAILLLFLKAPVSAGGLGWSETSSLLFFGVYGASGFALPLIGGFVADRWLGARRTVSLGALIMSAGHVTLAAAAFWHSYHIIIGALVLIMVGNGLFKTPLITLIGDLFPAGAGARQVGYGLYYGAINAGAFTASLVIGWVTEVYGWHFGFGLAGGGMIIAWMLFVVCAKRLLPPGSSGVREQVNNREPITALEWKLLRTLPVAAVLATLFATGWFQFEGYWYLAFDTQVDRTVGGFTLPTPWSLSFQTLLIVIGAPLVGLLAARPTMGRRMSPANMFAIGFLLCALAQLAGLIGFALAGDGRATLGWWVALYALTAGGELILWPSTYAMVYHYAPERFRSSILGLWLLTLAAGKFLAGLVGASATRYGVFEVFPWLTAALLVGGIMSLVLLPKHRAETIQV